MTQRVESIDLGIAWEPNAPDAVLIVRDSGETRLALAAHPDDADQRCVMLSWTGTAHASMSESNDEVLAGHRLYDVGLSEVRWLGVVHDSALIEDLEARNRVHPGHRPARYADLTHYLVLLKETTVEVVAREVETLRIPASVVHTATGRSSL